MKSSRYFFIAFILFVLMWVIYLFKPFLLTISIGVLLAVSTANINIKFLKLTKNKEGLSATLTTLALSMFFIIPFTYAAIKLAGYASNLDMAYITKIVEYIKNFDFKLPQSLSFLEPQIKEFIASFDINSLVKRGAEYTSKIGKSSAYFIVEMGLIIVFYFFVNWHGRPLLIYVKNSLPIDSSHLKYIFDEVANTMSVVLYSTILSSVLQGFLFGIMVAFFGYDGFLMAIVYAFASLIPAVGGALVYIPLCIYELASGNTFSAVFILSYSVIVISTIADNFIKPLIIKFINSKMLNKPANTNELVLFFAMMAGLTTFGFWGVILGPAIVTLFLATLYSYKYLQDEFAK